MSFSFKFYGNISVDNIENKLTGLDWDKYDFRQKTYSHHSKTKTIPLIWNEGTGVKYWENYSLFEDDINDINIFLNKILNTGSIKTAILINLPKKEKILSHYDRGVHFIQHNRIHIPIITNENCLFEIEGEIKNMKKGEVWEINNNEKIHSVENNGNEDRIHLLIDFLPKKIF